MFAERNWQGDRLDMNNPEVLALYPHSCLSYRSTRIQTEDQHNQPDIPFSAMFNKASC